MSKTGTEVLEKALSLPAEERAELADRLLTSLQAPSDSRLDELWAREAEDRLDAYDRGEISAVSAKDVFNEIRRGKP